jgi:hypothetical protein
MSKYRSQLPQLSKDPFITDGVIETTQRSIFLDGLDLPNFAAFVLFGQRPRNEGACELLPPGRRSCVALS